MTRPIKFRIWDKEDKKIRKVNSLHLETDQEGEWCVECYGKSYVTNEGDHDAAIDVIRGHKFTIMQFTGLHDKNGKEIWEGDIVLTFDPAHAKPMPMKIVYDVSPYCGFFKESVDCLRKVMLTNDIYCNTEVLGNIYENPELLTP